ncbi:MAG: hypothetical protein ACRDMU_00130 [Gaiellaceae bacterium]
MTGRSKRTRLPAALAIAASCAFVWSGVAVAQQQSETPNELWQEYPLNPAPGSPEPTGDVSQEDVSQAPSSRGGGQQVDDGGAAAADEEPFPLVQVALALGLLGLGILHGVFVLARRRGVPERMRARIGAVRSTPPSSSRRPSYASRRNPAALPAQGTQRRPKAAPADQGGAEQAHVAEERAEIAEERVEVAEARAEPAEERVEIAEERVEVAEARAEPAGKPVKPPKPKVPPAPPTKPSAHKPPPAKPSPAKPSPAKPPPAKPPRAAKPARPTKPVPTAKQVPADKPMHVAKRSKPARPPSSKPPAPEKPRAERQPRSEQPPPVAPDEERNGVLTCSIYWWRDGPVADFYALATGLQGRAWVVDRSPRFEWQAGDLPAEAREAHAALVEALVTAGWRQAGTEGVWYRQRFERPFAESS